MSEENKKAVTVGEVAAWANARDLESDTHIDCWAYKTPNYTVPLFRHPHVKKEIEFGECGTCGCQTVVHIDKYEATPAGVTAPVVPQEDVIAMRHGAYDVICDRRDLFDFLRAAWREGQEASGEMDERERWELATQHATRAITGWATLLHIAQEAPASSPAVPAGQDDARDAQPYVVLRYVDKVGGPLGDTYAFVRKSEWDNGLSRGVAVACCDANQQPLLASGVIDAAMSTAPASAPVVQVGQDDARDAARWRTLLDQAVDIYFDGIESPPDGGAYESGAFRAHMDECRKLLSTAPASEPEKCGCQQGQVCPKCDPDVFSASEPVTAKCPWPNCPHGAECVHAEPVAASVDSTLSNPAYPSIQVSKSSQEAASVDTPQFWQRVNDYLNHRPTRKQSMRALIAHITTLCDVARQEVEQAVAKHIVQLKAQLAGEKSACDALVKQRDAAQAGSELAGLTDASKMQDARVAVANLRHRVESFLAVYDQGDAPNSEQEHALRDAMAQAEVWLMHDARAAAVRQSTLAKKGGAA